MEAITAAILSMSAGTAAAIDVAIVSASLAATSAYSQGQQQKANAEYNAQVQKDQAQAELDAARLEGDRAHQEGRSLKAQQRVAYAKAALTAAVTPLLVLQRTARMLEEDEQVIRFGGRRRSAFREGEAQISLASGRSAARAGMIGAGSSLLAGGARLARYGGQQQYRSYV